MHRSRNPAGTPIICTSCHTVQKKIVEDPNNYRLISLIRSLYKVYASIIQTRLALHIEETNWKTQYGFRKDKSTSDAIHIIRRICHRGFTIQENVHVVLLDWEKAFDNIFHSKLKEAMRSLNIPKNHTSSNGNVRRTTILR